MKIISHRKIAAGVAMIFAAAASHAYVIDFSPLVGSNEATYAGHTQGGFTVSNVTGGWVEAHTFGNPVPAIFDLEAIGTLRVTGGKFIFESVDIGNANNNAALDYVIRGLLSGVEVMNVVGGFPQGAPEAFTTVNNLSGNQLIDELIITITTSTDYNVDNIVLNTPTAAAEPASLALLTLGLAGLRFSRRKQA